MGTNLGAALNFLVGNMLGTILTPRLIPRRWSLTWLTAGMYSGSMVAGSARDPASTGLTR